jgi:hypothetical protein
LTGDDNAGDKKLPTIREALSDYFGIQLPGLPGMPQTFKNTDKALGHVVLALGGNLSERIKISTGKLKASGRIEVEDLVRNAEERRKLTNRATISREALEEVAQHPGSGDAQGEISDDWLNSFSRIAEDKSSEDLQKLFAKILAGEIRQPGAFSLRTLQFVSTISREEADAISRFLSFIMHDEFVANLHEAKHGPNLSMRIMMEELGIASSPNSIGGLAWSGTIGAGNKMLIHGNARGILIENHTSTEVKFSIPCQVLSKPAKELIKIANAPPTPLEFVREVGQLVIDQLNGTRGEEVRSDMIVVQCGTVHPEGTGVRYNKVEQLTPKN